MDRFLSNSTSSLRNFKPFTFSNFTLQSSEILAIIANSACLEFTSLPRRTIARETVNLPALFAIRMERGWTGCRSPLPGNKFLSLVRLML